MTLILQDCLWGILETEADERYFIDDAEKPAFLILGKYNPLTHRSFELYMNNVSRLARCKRYKEIIARLDKILSTAKKPIRVYIQKKRGLSYGKKKLYLTVNPNLPEKEATA